MQNWANQAYRRRQQNCMHPATLKTYKKLPRQGDQFSNLAVTIFRKLYSKAIS